MADKYTWSDNKDDGYWMNAQFDSIEECIRDAVEGGEKKPGDYIAVGICEDYVPQIDVDSLLEKVGEDAYEEVGEVAEDWPYFVPRKGYADADKLQEKIDKVFKEWLEETGQIPHFYKIYPLSELVKIPEVDECKK